MQFNTFTFRAEWLEAAQSLNDEALSAELLMAITTYGITGEYTPSQSAVINALMTIIKAQIDNTPARKKAIKAQTLPTTFAVTEEKEEAPAKQEDNVSYINLRERLEELKDDYYVKQYGRHFDIPLLMDDYATQCDKMGIKYKNTYSDTLVGHVRGYVEGGYFKDPNRKRDFFNEIKIFTDAWRQT